MKQFVAALDTEWMKFRRALAVLITTAMLVVGLVALCASFIVVSLDPGSVMAVKLSAMLTDSGWRGFFQMAHQISAVASFLGFGIVLAWLFGREFVDRAAPGLFGLPVSRPTIAIAKITVYLAWLVGVTLAVPAALIVTGLALGLEGTLDGAAVGKLCIVLLLTGTLALPAAYVATLSRGYLAPIGAISALVVLAQIAAVSPVGGWFPFATPGLWAGLSGAAAQDTVTTMQLALVPVVGAVFVALTVVAWRRLQL